MIKNNSDNWLNETGYKALPLEEYRMWTKSIFLYNINQFIKDRDKNIKILEPGCGSAKLGIALYLSGFKDVTLLDFHPITCKSLQTFVKENNLESIKIIQDKLENISEMYDVILNEGVMEHFLDTNERLKIYTNFYKHLNPNGILLVYVPCSNEFSKYESDKRLKELESPMEIAYTSQLLRRDLYITKFKNIAISASYQSKDSTKFDLLLGVGFKL